MKKILIKGLFLSLIVGFTSCEDDFLDQEHSTAVDPEVSITDEASLGGAVLGVYKAMQRDDEKVVGGADVGYTFGSYHITFQELLSDNGFVAIEHSGRFTAQNDYTHANSQDADIKGMWTLYYRVIARANNILAYEDKIDDDPAVKGTPKARFAEARTARALALFHLVNYFARPIGTINQELGVPVPLKFEIDQPIKRSTVTEVYTQIKEDLIDGIANGEEVSRGRLGKQAATLLLARVYLFEKDYTNALKYAEMALNSGFTTLLEKDKVKTYFNEKLFSSETVFELTFVDTSAPSINSALFSTWGQEGRYRQNYATKEFYDLMSAKDVRRELYREITGRKDNPNPYNVERFRALDDGIVYLRLSEAKLIQIEALYFTNPAQAATELNKWVSTYRDESYNFTATGQALLDEILKQRRIELGFEGHRLFDLNRYGLAVKKGANCRRNCEVSFDDYRRVFPIPQHEMLTNKLMVQNPTYK